MLEIAIVGLVIGAAYAVYLAPSDQKLMVGLVLVVLTAIGYGVGMAITKPGSDERTFYPIAAAIGGAMIAFGWISHKQKTWPKKEKQ
jgi:protein-S-isoprenylcysteine O-methyltransferase Ste14